MTSKFNEEYKGRNRHNVECFFERVLYFGWPNLKKAGLASRNIVHVQKAFYVVSVSAFIFFILFVKPIRSLLIQRIGKIFVYKHCFCYLNVENVKQKNSLFHQPIVLWLAY